MNILILLSLIIPVAYCIEDVTNNQDVTENQDVKKHQVGFTTIRLDYLIQTVCIKEIKDMKECQSAIVKKENELGKTENNPNVPIEKQGKVVSEIKALNEKLERLFNIYQEKAQRLITLLPLAVDRAIAIESVKNPDILNTLECKIISNNYYGPMLLNTRNKNIVCYDISDRVKIILEEIIIVRK